MGSPSWHQVAPPWRRAFELAWESHRLGSPGVGAVVADADGSIDLVACARDLVRDGTARRLRDMELDQAMATVWERLPS